MTDAERRQFADKVRSIFNKIAFEPTKPPEPPEGAELELMERLHSMYPSNLEHSGPPHGGFIRGTRSLEAQAIQLRDEGLHENADEIEAMIKRFNRQNEEVRAWYRSHDQP